MGVLWCPAAGDGGCLRIEDFRAGFLLGRLGDSVYFPLAAPDRLLELLAEQPANRRLGVDAHRTGAGCFTAAMAYTIPVIALGGHIGFVLDAKGTMAGAHLANPLDGATAGGFPRLPSAVPGGRLPDSFRQLLPVYSVAGSNGRKPAPAKPLLAVDSIGVVGLPGERLHHRIFRRAGAAAPGNSVVFTSREGRINPPHRDQSPQAMGALSCHPVHIPGLALYLFPQDHARTRPQLAQTALEPGPFPIFDHAHFRPGDLAGFCLPGGFRLGQYSPGIQHQFEPVFYAVFVGYRAWAGLPAGLGFDQD